MGNSDVRKALLVDDDAVQLRVREAVLRSAGVPVAVATSAFAALSMLRADKGLRNIGVVLTDHLMPGLSGREFVTALRSIVPEIPVVVISGLPEAEAEYDGLNVAFRPKPCPPPELVSVVKAALA